MNERKVFWFVLLMAAFVLVGVWRIAGWAGVLLAVGSVGLYLAYDHERGKAHAATVRDSSEVVDSIARSRVGYFLRFGVHPRGPTQGTRGGKRKSAAAFLAKGRDDTRRRRAIHD